ncbi:DUF1435 domain-containing protein [Entomohabitans teleogrylli]|uniref:DUF1435 domain-containing protein n=1 Tax=Entomohabitans teleogrylli TaxID=1384589 RepID=UPI00073D5531|nr:DUF1435 family protein [Entomohabitans teleogrylli]
MQKRLESGWGMLLPGLLVLTLAMWDLTFSEWRVLLVAALLSTSGMLFHKRLRHFILLPSCVAFAGSLLMLMMSLGLFAGR